MVCRHVAKVLLGRYVQTDIHNQRAVGRYLEAQYTNTEILKAHNLQKKIHLELISQVALPFVARNVQSP